MDWAVAGDRPAWKGRFLRRTIRDVKGAFGRSNGYGEKEGQAQEMSL
jgi:hypothetical protein